MPTASFSAEDLIVIGQWKPAVFHPGQWVVHDNDEKHFQVVDVRPPTDPDREDSLLFVVLTVSMYGKLVESHAMLWKHAPMKVN